MEESLQQIWASIKYWLAWTAIKLKEVISISRRDKEILRCFNLPITKTREFVVKMVQWRCPKVGWVNLNMDGCSLGNSGPSSAKRVI